MSDNLNEIIFYLGYIKGKLNVSTYKERVEKVIEKIDEIYEDIKTIQSGVDRNGWKKNVFKKGY